MKSFEFEPLKGIPMLHWQGKKPFTNIQYYPAQLSELHGRPADGWFNQMYWGDNLHVMGHLLNNYRNNIDLIYIDPPFDSNADYNREISIKGKKKSVFKHKQYSDIWRKMLPRLDNNSLQRIKRSYMNCRYSSFLQMSE